ncbi:exodeoxyribonuclease VII [Neosynechococcus sphagnicola sy1]|uniref:Exodeoxyribonuclease VII small subunit n=1 Tax=Neosynechococcus sphagnicola sy1 TaxID=1497020 RepID=A0A098TIY8_9CYAN|nr:exodeoxyribonuclease VII [Neosynechococcus sphagnicola sy1]
MTRPRSPDLPPGWTYEAAVAKIEAIIAKIEDGELELAHVFDQFAIAVNHLHQCEAFLAQRQHQMDLLIETLINDPDL